MRKLIPLAILFFVVNCAPKKDKEETKEVTTDKTEAIVILEEKPDEKPQDAQNEAPSEEEVSSASTDEQSGASEDSEGETEGSESSEEAPEEAPEVVTASGAFNIDPEFQASVNEKLLSVVTSDFETEDLRNEALNALLESEDEAFLVSLAFATRDEGVTEGFAYYILDELSKSEFERVKTAVNFVKGLNS